MQVRLQTDEEEILNQQKVKSTRENPRETVAEVRLLQESRPVQSSVIL